MLGLCAALACAWAAPVIAPDNPTFGFDDLGLYEVGYRFRGGSEVLFPLGAVLDFEAKTGVACRRDQPQNGRQTFLLHCPWRDGTGVAFQRFTVLLPRVKSIKLTGATALRTDAVGKSDGVTFRIFVDQVKLLETNQADDAWRPFSFDLTGSGGKTVEIRFETDPGPRDDPSFDFSLWGDRTLVLEGYEPQAVNHPAAPALDLRSVAGGGGSVVPSSGFVGSGSTAADQDGAVLRYSGEDGEVTYRWRRPTSAADPPLGTLSAETQLRGDVSYTAPLAGDAAIEWTQAATWQESRWETGADGLALVSVYQTSAGTATLRARPALVGKSLVIAVSCDRAVVSSFNAGSWGPVYRKRALTVPYYSGEVDYLTQENLFVNAFLDWTASSASYFWGTTAGYEARTDGGRALLRERAVFSASWQPAEVLPNIPNPASPYRGELGGRMVLDIWGGTFADVAARLAELAGYGLDRCIALIHDWQRSGYDDALPMHIPARASLGGEDGMRELVRTAGEAGYLAALHENYADYYPDYDRFDENDVALDSTGARVTAWWNPTTQIQSFGERPDAMVRLAATQSPEIRRRYGTNASYLDVNSAVPPWKNVDHRATTKRSAEFGQYSDGARALWQFLRDTYHGPVFGEGGDHWYWSGLLDGVEAQFGEGWPAYQGPEAPLAVDFDLLKIHPLVTNHGMGYYERWWSPATSADPPPMLRMDQYRMQEIAYGHAPFIGSNVFWNTLPLAWLEHHLVTPVSAEYAGVRAARISYQIDGEWRDPGEAARRQAWNRVKVEYENGLVVIVNGADTAMTEGQVTLPPYGWLATSNRVTAGTTMRSGAVTDFADSGDRVFANARGAGDWNLAPRTALPSVASFAQTGSRTLRTTYQWQVFGAIPGEYTVFVHFVKTAADGSETIVFQQDHPPALATTAWQPGSTVSDGPYSITVPSDAPDGDYQWMAGLFLDSGPRLPLVGGDGESRVHLGVLHVRDGGRALTFDADAGAGQVAALYARNVNEPGAVIDFGPLRTDGSVLIRRSGDAWVLQTMPRERAFTIMLDGARFGLPASVKCRGGAQTAVTPEATDGGWWLLPMNGAEAYSWPAAPARGREIGNPRPPTGSRRQ